MARRTGTVFTRSLLPAGGGWIMLFCCLSERTRRTSTSDILPGTRSFDELEAVLSAKKKEKMSHMKEKFMKGFQKQQGKDFKWT